MKRSHIILLTGLALAVILGLNIDFTSTQAAKLQKPSGEVVVRIIGNIAHKNAGNADAFDRAMLAALPQHTINTTTKWTKGQGKMTFTGPMMKDLLSAVGARGRNIRVSAMDDYTVTLPIADFEEFPVILTLKMNGKALPEDRDPGWIMYPWDSDSALQVEKYISRAIWQVVKINVQ
jgi:hypothetical protein